MEFRRPGVRLGEGEVFGANYGSNIASSYNSSNVSLISDTSNLVVAPITVRWAPAALAYDPAKGGFFVADSASDGVRVITDSMPI
jgi:DNA-binding beta-propeller fold protein YncE